MIVMTPGQVWRDDCYYLDRQSKKCMAKYVLVLAVTNVGDALTAVFTSKPNGLTDNPACSLGPPRAGYYIGTALKVLSKPTWVDFSSVSDLDDYDLDIHIKSGKKTLIGEKLQNDLLVSVIRCLLQSEDITIKQARLLSDAVSAM